MNFLPIVTRELRVAARRRMTYWLRTSVALLAIGLSFFFILIFMVSPTPRGAALFVTLSYYAFGLCALAGVFTTADSLSEEKREGTLGLLFLTDLSGYDVVLGKFAAIAVNAFYGLLAVIPVMAIPILLGGVTGAEFWRMALALLNTLFFSLALGICVSAFGKDSQRTMGFTLAFLFIFIAGIPLASQLPSLGKFFLKFWDPGSVSPFWPVYYSFAATYAKAGYIQSLITSNVLAWGFLALASVKLPNAWQDRRSGAPNLVKIFAFDFAGRIQNPARRQKMLTVSPILWLMSGGRTLHWLTWIVAIVTAAIMVSLQVFGQDATFIAIFSIPLVLGLKIILAARATQFFVDARKSGALELLLSTPLTNQQIIQGQWLALKTIFMWPVIVVTAAMIWPIVAPIYLFSSNLDKALQHLFVSIWSLFGVGKFILDIFAIGWFGMWMGLSARRPALAPLWTILIGVILPAPLVMCCWADIAIDLVLIFWSKGKLEFDLRQKVSGGQKTIPF